MVILGATVGVWEELFQIPTRVHVRSEGTGCIIFLKTNLDPIFLSLQVCNACFSDNLFKS